MRLPTGALSTLSGGAKVNQAGQRLDARIQMALLLARTKPDIDSLPPQKARTQLRELVQLFDLPPEPLPRIENVSLPGVARISGRIPLRIYAPTNQVGALPTLVYFHGGGFVVGDLDSYDAMLRFVCKTANCAIVSVDYRLAPEHPFPAATEDALAAWGWIQKNAALFDLDASRMGVGGDSAGANLALNVCLQAPGQRLKMPAFNAMIYPWVDLFDAASHGPSFAEFAQGYGLTAKMIEYFTRHAFLSTQKLDDPRVSPIYAPAAQLKRVPPTFIQLCGWDPLRDQGAALGEKLRAAGADCETRMYDSLIHGATGLGGIVPDAKTMLADYAGAIAAFVKRDAKPRPEMKTNGRAKVGTNRSKATSAS